jgi:outer membrane protein TolC
MIRIILTHLASGPGRGIAAALLALTLAAIPDSGGSIRAQSLPDLTSIDPDSTLAAALAQLEGEPLSLSRAVDLALANATQLREARAVLAAAEGALLREKGAFDPELFANLTRSRTENPSSSPFSRPDVIENEETSTIGGARILLPLGTEIEASLTARRLDTNNEFSSIDPEYRADGRLEVRQPLLRGFGAGTSGAKNAAARSLEAAEAGSRDAELSIRSLVETTYWQLYTAERDLAVQYLIVNGAEALLDQAQLRAGAGLVGPNEVANARAFLAEQRLAALDQDERLGAISDRLASLLGTRPSGAARFRSSDAPPSSYAVDSVDSLLARAFRHNTSLRVAERNLASVEALARGASWNRFPGLDLVGSLGGTGLAGTPQDVVFGGEVLRLDEEGAYGDAIGEALGRDFPNWSVGVELTFPIPLREGRGERDRLRAEASRARAQVETVRRALEERIRSAHRELINSQERLEVAQEGIAASFEQVRIGMIEYENGRTTAFELVRLTSDLAEARQRLSDAQVRAATAAADLRYLTAGYPKTLTGVRP